MSDYTTPVTLSYEDEEGNPIEYTVNTVWDSIAQVIVAMDDNAE